MASLLLQRYYSNRSGLFIAGAVLFLSPTFLWDNETGPFTPLVFAVMMTWFSTIGMDMTDYKNDTDVLLNSLPVTRRQIVTSKYASTLFVGAVLIAVGKVTSLFVDTRHDGQLTDLFLAAMAVAFFTAVYFPLYFKLGTPFITLAFIVLMAFCFTVFPILFFAGFTYDFWGLPILWQRYTIPAIIGLCSITIAAVLISRSISIRLYEQKEF